MWSLSGVSGTQALGTHSHQLKRINVGHSEDATVPDTNPGFSFSLQESLEPRLVF
jgi:hypothetical protein